MDTFFDWTYIILRLMLEFAILHPFWTAFCVLMVVVETRIDWLVRAYLAIRLAFLPVHRD